MFKARILSVIMAIVLVVSCVPAITFGAFADDTASTVYYLKGGATGGDGTESAPFGTLKEIVDALDAAGLNVAGKEITIKVINASEATGYGEANALYINPYGYAATSDNGYSAIQNGDMSSVILHNATLVFESADATARPILWSANATVNRYVVLRLGGPTVFRNVDLGINRGTSGGFPIFSNGYDLTLEDVKFINNTGSETAASKIEIYGGTFQNNNGSKLGDGGTVTIDAATLGRINYVTPMGWATNIWSSYDAVSAVVSAGYQNIASEEKIVLPSGTLNNLVICTVGGGTKTYGDNVNIVLNGTTVKTFKTSNTNISIADGKAVQLIYNNGATITSDSFTTLPRYDIVVENGGALDTTAEAGVYKVTFPEGKNTAVATDASGNEYTNVGDLLTVGAAGKYNVTFTATETVPTYYIKSGATGTGKSSDSPAGTMSALVAQIEADGLNVSGKEVVVKLMNGTGRFAYNSENGAYKVVPYNATLIFERFDDNTTANLWATNHLVDGKRDDYSFLRLGGPTVMRNISLSWQISKSDWRQHYANGHNWTLENVTFRAYDNSLFTNNNDVISLGFRGGDNVFHIGGGTGGTLYIDEATTKNHIWGYLDFAGNKTTEVYDEDVKLVVGATSFPSGIRLSGGAKATFNKNANIVLNGTTVNGISISGSATIAEGHALQIIYNNGATITGTDAAKNMTRYDIFVENIEGAALDTTATAGTYAVTYPESKPVVYAYAVDASGNYDGTTPVYYTSAETITVGTAGRYEVGFAATVSDIDVEIVNDYAEFDGWSNDEEKGTLTPIAAASNVFDTDVSAIDGTIIYTADITIGKDDKAIVSANGDNGETDSLVELSDGALKIAGFTVAGTFENGTYGVKLTIAPEAKALVAEVTKPDGTVIRRGNDAMLAGNASFDSITVKATDENAVANEMAVKGDFTPDSYTINEQAPTLSDFEENVYNIVTSYNVDAKTTRSFAFTVKSGYLADGEEIAVKYNVKGSDEVAFADAVKKAEKTEYSDVDFYEVDISNLKAGTTYEYSIGKKNGAEWSDTYSFTTEKDDEEGFSFITISDTQGTLWNGDRGFMYAQSAINEALEDVEAPAFILNAGDVIEGNSSDVGKNVDLEVMWKNYFMAMGDTLKSIPHFAAMGNHDYHGHGNSADCDFLFNLHFNHPDNGGKAAIPMWANMGNYVTNVMNNPKETAYSFDYDNAHFTVINSGPSGNTDKWLLGAQKTWITNDITNSDAQWKIVVIHQPAYDAAGTNEVLSYYSINTLIEELGVDLVIQGHSHYNTRTYPMKNGTAVRTNGDPDLITKGEGTVYSIVGATATNHDVLKDNLNENYVSVFSPASEMPVYAVVDVADDTLTYTVKQLDGFVVDQFTIEKDTSYRTPETVGVQIRIPSDENTNIKQGLRFVSSIPREVYDELAAKAMLPETANDTGIGFGSVIIPKDYIPEGEKLTKKTYDAGIVPAVNIMELGEESVIFTVCLVDIIEKNYTRDYCVVPYVTVKNGDEEITYYGEMQTANVYRIALLACGEDSTETEYTKEYLKEKVIDVVEAANK